MKIEEITPKLLDHIFGHLDTSKLDEWNQKFVVSTKTWWNQKHKLSDKQKLRLSELWEKQIADAR
jgi:hypothetical protein